MPAAPMIIKTMRGLAFRLDAFRSALTHHMPIVAPARPPSDG